MSFVKDAVDTGTVKHTTSPNPSPLISVIMNCYNSSKYLHEAIDSVLAQTYTNWELIFWDNQSTDNSAEIFKSYNDPRLRYFYATEHTTLGTARNLALEKINGEWFGILDCDDLWIPEKLSHQLAHGLAQNGVGLVYSDANIIDEDGNIKKAATVPAKIYQGQVFDEVFAEEFTVCWPTVLFNSDVIKETGSFASYKYLEDFDILLRVARNHPFVFVNEKLASYRVHSGQASVKYQMMLKEKLEIMGKWGKEWLSKNELTAERKQLLSKARGKANAIAGINAAYYGDSSTRYYLASLRQHFTLIVFIGFFISLLGPKFTARTISFIRRISGRAEYH